MVNKKGLVVTLLAVALMVSGRLTFGMAPVITDPGDYIVGDLEDGAANNVFGFPDAINFDQIVSDDNTPDSGILWSYDNAGIYNINGVAPIGAGNKDAPGANELRGQDNDNPPFLKSGGAPQDGTGATGTIRNVNLSPGFGSLGPYVFGGPAGIIGSETQVVTLYASDGATHGLGQTIVVYTANDTSDSLSGGMENLFDFDFVTDANKRTGWLPQIFGGATAGTTGTGTGFCMWVPLTNTPTGAVYWYSPNNSSTPNAPGYITLVDSTVYRVRAYLYTDQTGLARIPFWTFGFSNVFYTPSLSSNIYGGDFMILDVAGGTNGINRTQGRDSFDFWFAPNAMLTKQWRGQDAWNSTFSPFNPTVDNRNDMNLQIRILDGNQAAGGILNQNDTGTICLKRLRADRILYSKLSATLRNGGPINTATHAILPDMGTPAGNGGFPCTIDNVAATARFIIGPSVETNANGGRKKLCFYDPAGTDNTTKNWPFASNWNSNELLLLKTRIRSDVGGAAGTVEGTDPINILMHTYDTPTAELGSSQFTQKGVAGNMKWAASPRLLFTTGNAQGEQYVTFFFTENRTKNPPAVTNGDRIRGYGDFINNSGIGNSTDGGNPFVVETLELWVVDTTGY